MTIQSVDCMTIARIARLIQRGGPVLAITDDGSDQRHAVVRAAAGQLARAAAVNVLLFHSPPGGSAHPGGRPRLFDPRGGTSADPGTATTCVHTGTRRRDLLRDEAAEIRAVGPEVRVWLSRLSNPAGIVEAVGSTGAGLVLIPAEPERTGPGGRVIRLTLPYYAMRIPVPVVAVDTAGRMTVVAPLGAGRRVAGARTTAPIAPASSRLSSTVAVGSAG